MDKLLFLVTKQFLVTYAKHKTARIYEKKNTLRVRIFNGEMDLALTQISKGRTFHF